MKKNQFEPLDRYEKQIIEDMENDRFVSVKNSKKEVKKYTQLFREASKKDKRITIRVSSNDLEDIQKKAKYTGIPYQTLIASILHQFASGKVQIDM